MSSSPSLAEKYFLEHPRSVGETYGEHLRAALGFGARLCLAGLACMWHALCPWCFVHTASRRVSALHRQMRRRAFVGMGAGGDNRTPVVSPDRSAGSDETIGSAGLSGSASGL